MKKIAKKKRTVAELFFNKYDGPVEIYAYNTKHKKRLSESAASQVYGHPCKK